MTSGSDSILFTFDDYGTSAQITKLLKVLGDDGVKAVFFLQGDWAEKNPALVAKIQAAGQLIGNHTYSHADLLSLSDKEVRQEIAKGPSSAWLRPPRGRYNDRIRKIASEFGMTIKYWSIDSDDWQGFSKDVIVRKVAPQLKSGAVILFHIHADQTVLALPELIEQARARGFQLATPDEDVWGSRS
jgi:peptidoglycan/xylan/chitin deacetylase (PgdA/CDA1 family)